MMNAISSIASFLIILAMTGCRGQESGGDVGIVRSEGVAITAYTSGDKLVVRVDNNSNEIISIADEPLVGFGLNSPRIGLVVKKDESEIIPCAQVGMPRDQGPMIRLSPGQSKERDLSLGVVRRVYCLDSGSYLLRATYPADSLSPSVSEEVVIKF